MRVVGHTTQHYEPCPVRFQTNLDLPKAYVRRLCETWAGPVPTIGSRVTFNVEGRQNLDPRTFELQVVGVNWDEQGHAMVELHIPTFHRNIPEWSAYYRRHVEGRE